MGMLLLFRLGELMVANPLLSNRILENMALLDEDSWDQE
jgi:hypothetical protein